jgi:hypothetical protein
MAAASEKLYFGKPCKQGHDGTRYTRTDECLECKRAHRRRWKKSDNGRKAGREWARKKYVPSTRVRLTPEERKARVKASWLKTLSKPEVKAKRRVTSWKWQLKRRYGLTPAEFDAMAASGCQICGASDTPRKRLHVDHNHKTGKVRGLLCDNCNKGIGCLRDDPTLIFRALLYLRRAGGG